MPLSAVTSPDASPRAGGEPGLLGELATGGDERVLAVGAARRHLDRGADGVPVDGDEHDLVGVGQGDDEDGRAAHLDHPVDAGEPSGRTTSSSRTTIHGFS